MDLPNDGIRGHKLMPAKIERMLPALGSQDGKGAEATAYLKLFHPMGRMTLFVTEFDGEDQMFGWMLSPLGPDFDEWGYSSLHELAESMALGLPTERDCHWPGPMSVREAIEHQRAIGTPITKVPA